MTDWTKAISLCSPTDRSVKELIQSDLWIMEEKYDGDRVVVSVNTEGDGVTAFGRRNELQIPKAIRKAEWGAFQFVLDGEMLGSTYMVFDILNLKGVDCRTVSLSRRKTVLGQLSPYLPEQVKVVPFASTERDKLAMLKAAVAENKEGVVVKLADYAYAAGRGSSWQKLKFYKTLDAVILSIGEADGSHPEAARLGLYWHDDPVPRDIGGVKIPWRYQQEEHIAVGDVIEARYLTVTNDFKLFQPTYVRKRTDKVPGECYARQMLDRSTSLPYYMGSPVE